MKTARRLISQAWLGMSLLHAACSGGGTGIDSGGITFERVAQLEGQRLTQALAVDPTGRWLVSINGFTGTYGDALHVYDLGSLEPVVDPLALEGAASVAISSDGAVAVVAGDRLFGTIVFSLPDLREVARFDTGGNLIIRNGAGSGYFVGGSFGIQKITSSGTITSDTLGINEVLGLSLTPDEATLLVLWRAVPGQIQLTAVDPRDLTRQAPTRAVPIQGTVLVPLEGSSEVLILGTTLERPFRAPIVGVVVDWLRGEAREPRELASEFGIAYFGFANPTAGIGPTTVLVPTSFGVITVDTQSGGAVLLDDDRFEGGPPCCVIAFDPSRGHVIAPVRRENFEIGGPPVVYRLAP